MSRSIRELNPWPQGLPLTKEGVFLFYDPATDDEYRVLPAQVGGTAGDGEVVTEVPNVEVGGIPAGVEVTGSAADLWRQALKKFLAPAPSTFTFLGGGSRSVKRGTSFPGGPAAFAWATSNPANVAPRSLALSDATAGTSLAQGLAASGSTTATISGFTAGTGVARTYRLAGTDTRGVAFAGQVTITGLPALMFGVSALAPADFVAQLTGGGALTDARLAALGLAETLQEGKTFNSTYNCTGGRYIYVLWDAAYGAEPVFGQVRSGVNTFSAYTVAGAAITDAFGIGRSYRVLGTGIQFGAAVNLNILS